MLDLQSSVPTFYWTYDSFSAHQYWGYEDAIWIEDRLERPVIQTDSIAFDAPEEWNSSTQTVRLALGADGIWRWSAGESAYEAVRTETRSHVMLTGTWRESGYRGAFVAVFPSDSGDGQGGL